MLPALTYVGSRLGTLQRIPWRAIFQTAAVSGSLDLAIKGLSGLVGREKQADESSGEYIARAIERIETPAEGVAIIKTLLETMKAGDLPKLREAMLKNQVVTADPEFSRNLEAAFASVERTVHTGDGSNDPIPLDEYRRINNAKKLVRTVTRTLGVSLEQLSLIREVIHMDENLYLAVTEVALGE